MNRKDRIMDCFICNAKDAEANQTFSAFSHDIKCFNCHHCGLYGVDNDFGADFQGKRKSSGFELKAPILAVERKLAGRINYVLTSPTNEMIGQSKSQGQVGDSKYYWLPVDIFLAEYPRDSFEVFNRTLLNLSRSMKHLGDRINLNPLETNWISMFYSNNVIQFRYICGQLINMGYLEGNMPHSENQGFDIIITAKGWERIDNLKMKSPVSGTAFVAMWFSNQTKKYREIVQEAIKRAGYLPVIVDQEHFNGYIMDKITSEIKDARFIVADFTCVEEKEVKGIVKDGVRGGVYFEAGFAKGLGREVIHTCRDDEASKKRLHFDISQINTILWEDTGDTLVYKGTDLTEVIRQRIVTTVGKGPNPGH